jgi:hypothetical protein
MPRRPIAPSATPAGSTVAPAPSTASRAPIVPAIAVRAYEWHSGRLGKLCACWGRDYPCADCQHEIVDLTALLDSVVRDTIRVVTVALERLR